MRAKLDAANVRYRDEPDLDTALQEADVIYQTRIQRERFATPQEYQAVEGIYTITPDSMALLGPDAIVMHPLPRVDEISPDVDSDPRAAYFRQARNGVFIRMALLNRLLGENAAN